MDSLREYLNSLSISAQEDFAERCGTTLGYLRKAVYSQGKFGVELALKVEVESDGRVSATDTCPDFDWERYCPGPKNTPAAA